MGARSDAIVDELCLSTLNKASEDKVRFVRLQFSDLNGNIKSVTILAEKLDEALERGIWFDSSSIEGFTRICESDMFLKPDPSTYALIPWEKEKTARLICDVFMPNGQPFEGDPRFILKKALNEALESGFTYNVGPEFEFFLFKSENGSPTIKLTDGAGYFDFPPLDAAVEVKSDIALALNNFGIEVETSHHEVASSQHEIDFKYSQALKTADNSVTFKHVVKSIAHLHGFHASFMPKPVNGINGNGMHVHQSLFTLSGENAFFDESGDYKLSDSARHFIAGQLHHAKALTALVCPTVNSFKRLVPGFEAPVYICWGQVNRSALIRVPAYSKGREHSTRIELRCPDPSCNPYLAFAAMLKAGLHGLKKKLIPPLPVEEDVYGFNDLKLRELNIDLLPRSLGEALAELKQDEVIQAGLGQHALEKFLELKSREWQDFAAQVSPWELNRYLKTV